VLNFLSFLSPRCFCASQAQFDATVEESKKLNAEAMASLNDMEFAIARNNAIKRERAEHLKQLVEQHDLEVAKKGSGAEHPSVGDRK
jgi:hypothetical protein